MKLLVINGPNLNLLGLREPAIYGSTTYAQLQDFIQDICAKEHITVEIKQSNHEGVIVDMVQEAYGNFDGIIMNPAAYTHTSVAILDALKSVGLPAVEVHISNIFEREDFRHISYPGKACVKSFIGYGIEGYRKAILFLKDYINQNNKEKEAIIK